MKETGEGSIAVLEKAVVSIRKSLARLVKAGTLTETQIAEALSRITTTTDPAEAVREGQAVIEAVPGEPLIFPANSSAVRG